MVGSVLSSSLASAYSPKLAVNLEEYILVTELSTLSSDLYTITFAKGNM